MRLRGGLSPELLAEIHIENFPQQFVDWSILPLGTFVFWRAFETANLSKPRFSAPPLTLVPPALRFCHDLAGTRNAQRCHPNEIASATRPESGNTGDGPFDDGTRRKWPGLLVSTPAPGIPDIPE